MRFHLSEQRRKPKRYVVYIPFSVSNPCHCSFTPALTTFGFWFYQRLAKKELKRSRRAFRGEMPLPNSDLYLASQQQSCVTMLPPPPPPPPPPAMGFPTPTSPMAPLQMLGGDGERVESSDEDGDDEDDEDEFEDSEQTEATATEADVEEGLTSEGEELSATPERAATAAEKWVALKGQAPEHHPSSLPPPPPSSQVVPPGAVTEAVSALSR
ncbi:hypothetical protein EDB85DRAFT_998617 [Lactarius pseudohatsudake]|nr:hypothetical protein EDB85DRAFT_998617 [Lactarius pseudohatsudake]